MLLYTFVVTCLLSAVSVQMITTDDILESMKIKLDKKCIKQKIGLEKYQDSKKDFGSCLRDFQQEFGAILNGDTQIFLESFCQNSDVQVCPQVVKTKFNDCLNDKQKKFIQFHIDAGKESLNYLCKNNEKATKAFQNVDLSKCKSSDALKQQYECQKLRDKLYDIDMDDYFKIEACRIHEQYFHCSADILKICGDEATSQFISEMGHSTIKATPCENLLTSNPASNLTKIDPTVNSPSTANSTGTKTAFSLISLIAINFFIARNEMFNI